MSKQPRALELATELRAGTLLLSEVDEAAEHLERLHAENEALRKDLKTEHALSFRDQVASLQAEIESKGALLRRALEALETDDWQKKLQAAIDIRNHTSPKGATQ